MGVDISPTIVSHLNLKPNSLWRGRPIKSFLTTNVSE
jgi:hypothetical protein